MLTRSARCSRKPDWGAGTERHPGRPRCRQEHRRHLLCEPAARREVQGLHRLRRFSRAARQGEGRERGQNHDAGPSPRRDRHGGHEEGQARHRAQAHRQPPEGSQAGDRDRARHRRVHALHAVGRQRIDGAGDGLDQGRLHRHAARNPQLDQPAGVAAVCDRCPTDTPPVPKDFDWDLWLGPEADRPYHPNYTHMVFRGWYDFGGGSMADMGHYSLWTVFNALRAGSAHQRRADAQPRTARFGRRLHADQERFFLPARQRGSLQVPGARRHGRRWT